MRSETVPNSIQDGARGAPFSSTEKARRLTRDNAEDDHEKASARTKESYPAKNDGDPRVDMSFDDGILLVAGKASKSQPDSGDR